MSRQTIRIEAADLLFDDDFLLLGRRRIGARSTVRAAARIRAGADLAVGVLNQPVLSRMQLLTANRNENDPRRSQPFSFSTRKNLS